MSVGSQQQLASESEVKINLNTLFFSYGVGYSYFNLLFPAMAVIFSYNLHAVKLVYALYFVMAGCLLLVPGILVY